MVNFFSKIKTDECGRVLEGISGTIKSPGYDTGGYANNVKCDNIISVDAGHVVEITFDDFRVECCCDKVQVGY